MRIFKHENASRTIVAYDSFDLELALRHSQWCDNKQESEKNIYVIFLIEDHETFLKAKAELPANKFCLLYDLNKQRDAEWKLRFCKVSFSEDWMGNRLELKYKFNSVTA